jgi:hypothetical protein
MAKDDRILACLVGMACRAFLDDPYLASIHAREAFAVEQTAAYDRQAEQPEVDAAVAEADASAVAEVVPARAKE